MIFFLLALFTWNVHAQAPKASIAPAAPVEEAAPSTTATPEAAASPSETAAPEAKESDYEVDYEEEPGGEEGEEPVEVKPTKSKEKKVSGKKNPKESVSQGSRAEKKIAPMMKSETKSIYKKNGKALDVDSD